MISSPPRPFSTSPPYQTRSFGFHAQQAVEKAFKAVLADHGASFPFTHNVGLLMTLCADTGALAPSSLADADLLTPYGVALRYGAKSPGTVDRPSALRLAGNAVAWARGLLSG